MTDQMQAWQQWLSTRPECVQKLAQKFPPGAQFTMDGILYYVIGYREPDVLIISHVNPWRNYHLAMQNKEYICADHFL